MKLEIRVNGERRELEAEPGMPLLWALRDLLGLKGTKFGCGRAQCGACTVLVDGRAMRSCVLGVDKLDDREVTTIEGLDPGGDHPLQVAWREANVPQCGYCQSGQIMTAAALLAKSAKPSNEEIDRAMAGNLCRCGTYVRIRDAIRRAAVAS